MPGDSAATRVPWQPAQSFTKLLYTLTLGGLLALALPFLGNERKRLTASVFLIVFLLGTLGGSLTAVFSPRYNIMFTPMVWILASATAALLWSRSWQRLASVPMSGGRGPYATPWAPDPHRAHRRRVPRTILRYSPDRPPHRRPRGCPHSRSRTSDRSAPGTAHALPA